MSATEAMKDMSNWDPGCNMDKADSTKNVEVANRAFQMLICARIFILKKLFKNLPRDTDPMVARRRWVLVQVLPPSFRRGDIFDAVIRSLRNADTEVMHSLVDDMLSEMENLVGKAIFSNKPLFAVVDEAQVAAQYLPNSFRSSSGTDMRPVLHAFHRFLRENNFIQGVILAGTGLSRKMVRTAASSQSARASYPVPFVFTEVGRFTKDDQAHEDYIRQYLELSPNSHSDQRLVERILYWFSGRWVQLLTITRHH
jgi:hypothetical protein